MKYKRSLRVSELIKREISTLISLKIKDPWLKSVILTHVKVSDDLKYAKIYFRVIGKEDSKEKALKGLERATKFIRAEIGNRTELRYVPEIQFFYDTSIDYANHINLLLEQIRKENHN